MSSLTVDVETTTVKKARTTHKQLSAWGGEVGQLCQPDGVHWCDGSHEEYQVMLQLMVLPGTAIRLADDKRPNSILVRSSPADVARVEDRTFICSRPQEQAGPTNNWEEPAKMKQNLPRLFAAALSRRLMHVIPSTLPPLTSPT